MLNDSTVTKLQEMKLSVMAAAFREQLKNANLSDMAFEERFGLLIDMPNGLPVRTTGCRA